MSGPTLPEQEQFWNSWNERWRTGELDYFMRRQAEAASSVARRLSGTQQHVLDIGCGTGWLGAELRQFGPVTGIDLSSHSLEVARSLHPDVTFVHGDFLTADLPSTYTLAVSADSFAHVYDQSAFIARVAALLQPGGTFLLMTQNRFVWDRRSRLIPAAPGQLQYWPPLNHLKAELRPYFRVRRITSLDPGGDQGILRWVENQYLNRTIRAAHLWSVWVAILERLRLGRELVIEAVRRTGDEDHSTQRG
jgi:SAM-dependent methyltransferase